MAFTHTARKVIYLADDDEDDCMLFRDALQEFSISYDLVTAKNG